MLPVLCRNSSDNDDFMKNIRNFCIIAHIDHGKSTLADRLLETTGAITRREMTNAQILDDNPLEQERGITIKLHAIQMNYRRPKEFGDKEVYTLNLIDTPGHVDFSYEVSRSLKACEGALLIVDATQGVEAQTISNLYLAIDADLEIIPVINKIDLPAASTTLETVKAQVMDLIGCKEEEMIMASAKSGIGIDEILEAIVERVPAPKGDPDGPLRALIFDSVFDSYRGAVAYVRVIDGTLRAGEEIVMMHSGKKFEIDEAGLLRMGRVKAKSIECGSVGYFTASIKDVNDTKVGDTVTLARGGAPEPIPGYQEVKPMVFAGLYPADSDDYEALRDALDKLSLNDSSLFYEPETSTALGFGFRCGFLGLLHMEIVQERLDREFEQVIVTTVPNVEYLVTQSNGEEVMVDNPADMPPVGKIDKVSEPFIRAQIICPDTYIGPIMKLCMERRAIFVNTKYLSQDRVDITYEIPLGEVIFDFYDRLKSVSRGYASFDYELIDMRAEDLVKVDILLNGDKVDALSLIVHRSKAYHYGRKLTSKLKELIPRQMFEVAVQAAIGAKVIARDTIRAMRKDVTSKCYGGDISRKRKLLERQKEGKKRMKQVGSVEIPQEAFLAVLSMDDD